MGSNKSRTFYTQAILPGASLPIPMTSTGQGANSDKQNSSVNKPPEAKNMVRTDCREQKLEKFLVSKGGYFSKKCFFELWHQITAHETFTLI